MCLPVIVRSSIVKRFIVFRRSSMSPGCLAFLSWPRCFFRIASVDAAGAGAQDGTRPPPSRKCRRAPRAETPEPTSTAEAETASRRATGSPPTLPKRATVHQVSIPRRAMHRRRWPPVRSHWPVSLSPWGPKTQAIREIPARPAGTAWLRGRIFRSEPGTPSPRRFPRDRGIPGSIAKSPAARGPISISTSRPLADVWISG